MGYFSSEKIAEGITRILCPGNVYAFLAEGTDSAVLIDTGFGVGSLKEYVESLTTLPLQVVLTHGHLDHAGGAVEFDTVYLNERDLTEAKVGTTVENRAPRFPKEMQQDVLPPRELDTYLPLQDGQTFDLGGLTIKMLKLYGHTPGCMCALFCERRLILLGDACNSYGYMQLPGSSSVKEYRDHLSAFCEHADEFDQAMYSHPHNFGGKEILQETLDLCDEILSGKRQGKLVENAGMPYSVWVAKPIDGDGKPLDGSCANFLYKSVF